MSRTAAVEMRAVPGIPMIEPGDDLATLIAEGLARANLTLREGDVIVIAQKIVSKAEDRSVDLATVVPSARAIALAGEIQKDPRLVELILSESVRVVRSRPNVLIVEHRLGFVMANAGVDQSNVASPDGGQHALLLPVDPTAVPRPCDNASPPFVASRLRSSSPTVSAGHGGAARQVSPSVRQACRRCWTCVAIPTCSAAPCRSASAASPTKSPPPGRW